MAPRYKFTKEEIVNASLNIARKEGIAGVTARAVAAALGSSPKVIFGSFQNMDDLQQEVIAAAENLNREFMYKAMAEGKYPPYKAGGMAYIQFARDEKELFKLLYMRKRSEEILTPEEDRAKNKPIIDVLCKNTGLTEDEAYLLHLEMWIFVHGIGTMIATSYLEWDEEFISKALTDAYLGLKYRFCGEEKENGSNQN